MLSENDRELVAILAAADNGDAVTAPCTDRPTKWNEAGFVSCDPASDSIDCDLIDLRIFATGRDPNSVDVRRLEVANWAVQQ